jgi:hypothetical protein
VGYDGAVRSRRQRRPQCTMCRPSRLSSYCYAYT